MHRDIRKLSDRREKREIMTIENRLYNGVEAAKLLGVTTKTLYNYILGNQLKAQKRGRRWYIDGDELKDFMTKDLPRGYYKNIYGTQSKKKDKEGQ